jgi:hypothetical protein
VSTFDEVMSDEECEVVVKPPVTEHNGDSKADVPDICAAGMQVRLKTAEKKTTLKIEQGCSWPVFLKSAAQKLKFEGDSIPKITNITQDDAEVY